MPRCVDVQGAILRVAAGVVHPAAIYQDMIVGSEIAIGLRSTESKAHGNAEYKDFYASRGPKDGAFSGRVICRLTPDVLLDAETVGYRAFA
jgi:hypothetical protein